MFVHALHVESITEKSSGTRLEAVTCEKCQTNGQPAVHATADRQRESGGWSCGLGRDFAARRMQPSEPFFAPIGCVAPFRCCMGSPMTTTGGIIAPRSQDP